MLINIHKLTKSERRTTNDERTVHFVFPDLPDYVITCDESGPKLNILEIQYYDFNYLF